MNIRYILSHKLGIDAAVFYTLMGRIMQIGTAVCTVLFIGKYLSPEEQGFYYTFGSLAAIQVFFELGLTSIVTQFVAHESSGIVCLENGLYDGDAYHKSRLSSLLHFCVKWYAIFAVIMMIILTIVGIYFFKTYNDSENVNWYIPWVLLVIGTAVNFFTAPLSSFIEGLGKVKEIAQIRLVQQLFYPIIIWGGLILQARLFVLGLYSLSSAIIFIVVIRLTTSWKMLCNIWHESLSDVIGYKEEIFPLQWRIAISWISGYFIFQLFSPVLFATEGAIVAGQMGMTMAALNSLNAMIQSWISTKIPVMSKYIALKEYFVLDTLFLKTMKQMLLIGTMILVFFVIIIFVIQECDIYFFGINNIGDRFLPMMPLCLMSWSIWTLVPINCWATYLRCHKREPLMWNSLVVGCLCCVSTLFFGTLYGLYGICISFALLRFISLIWIYVIYKKKKNEWHS